MNRWLVAALVTLALIVLVSPGIVGHLAEKSVEENLNLAAGENDDIVVTTESFDRGWFTSEGRHRIELRQGALHSVFVGEDDASNAIPALVVDTHVDHGLLPLSSLARDVSSLKPGLASTVSTIALDPGDGEIIKLPGKIYSEVGLSGATASRFVLEAGSRNIDGGSVEWQGADVTVKTNPASGAVSVDGSVQPWDAIYEGGGEDRSRISFGDIRIYGQQEKSPYGLAVGNIKLDVGPASAAGGSGPANGFQSLSIDAHSEIIDDRMNSAAKLAITGIKGSDLGGVDIALDVIMNGLNAQAAGRIARALQGIQGNPDPQGALSAIYPLIESDVQTLLVSGMEIRFDRLDVALPDGELTTKLRFSLPPTAPQSDFSWPALLLALDASADIRLPVALFEMAQEMSPDAGMLVAMGVLKKSAGYYEMQAEYAKGLVTVNGAPMPIPLQALQQ